jgi:hypothetical protein
MNGFIIRTKATVEPKAWRCLLHISLRCHVVANLYKRRCGLKLGMVADIPQIHAGGELFALTANPTVRLAIPVDAPLDTFKCPFFFRRKPIKLDPDRLNVIRSIVFNRINALG